MNVLSYPRTHDALVDHLVARGVARTPRVIGALRRARRHWFVPNADESATATDRPMPVGYGQTISQPTVVAEMTEALDLHGSERVLEIGTGSGWQAAVLASLAAEVYTIERVPELAARASEALSTHGFANVHVRVGDGFLGWPELAPFDRVIITAAPSELPRVLVDQLVEGGLLVAPVGDFDQTLYRVRKQRGALEAEELFPVVFVPMLPGVSGRRPS